MLLHKSNSGLIHSVCERPSWQHRMTGNGSMIYECPCLPYNLRRKSSVYEGEDQTVTCKNCRKRLGLDNATVHSKVAIRYMFQHKVSGYFYKRTHSYEGTTTPHASEGSMWKVEPHLRRFGEEFKRVKVRVSVEVLK